VRPDGIRLFALHALTFRQQQSDDTLRVLDLPRRDKIHRLRKGHALKRDVLVFIAGNSALTEAGGQEEVDELRGVAGCHEEATEPLKAFGAVADLFLQLPLRGVLDLLTLIDAARRYLEQRVFRREAVLPYKQDIAFVVNRDDSDDLSVLQTSRSAVRPSARSTVSSRRFTIRPS